MQLRGRIDPGNASSNRSETLRFVPRENIAPTAFLATNLLRIPQRTFPKRAKVPAFAPPLRTH